MLMSILLFSVAYVLTEAGNYAPCRAFFKLREGMKIAGRGLQQIVDARKKREG
jgi:hypothetical protein